MNRDISYLLADPAKPCLLADQRLHVRDGRIEDVTSEAPQGARSGLIALPAFANAHDHGRGYPSLSVSVADGPLEIWMARLGLEPRTIAYLGAACAFTRMAEAGIGATVHCHNTQNGQALLEEGTGVARAATDVGLRVAFALPFAGENPFVYGDNSELSALMQDPENRKRPEAPRYRRSLNEGMRIFEALKSLENDNFTLQFGPVGPQWTNYETLTAIADRSAEQGRRVHMHLLETRIQREWADRHYPDGIINYFDDIGLLSDRLTLAHCVWLRDAELALLQERRVSIACNISSNMRLSSGLPAIGKFLRSGINIGIGLDGMSLEDDDDILRESRLFAGMAQAMMPGVDGIADRGDTQATTLQALMQGGRRIVTGEGQGTLLPGDVADFVLLDTTRLLRHTPDPMSVDLLLARATAGDVRTLVIGGRSIVENGHCITVVRQDVERELTATAKFIARKAGIEVDTGLHDWQEGVRRFYRNGGHTRTPG